MDVSVGVDVLLHFANAKWNYGDVAGAQDAVNDVLSYCPDHPLALHLAAQICMTKGKFGDAASNLQRGLRQMPDDWRMLSDLAYCDTMLGDMPHALQLYNSILQLVPNEPNCLFNRGSIKLALGEMSGARVDLAQATSLAPQSDKAWLSLAMVDLCLEQFENALSSTDKFEKIYCEKLAKNEECDDDAESTNFAVRAAALRGMMRMDEAVVECHRALEVVGVTSEVRSACKMIAKSCHACGAIPRLNNELEGSLVQSGKQCSRTKLCSRCRVTRYCSAECQQTDWTAHKHVCRKK